MSSHIPQPRLKAFVAGNEELDPVDQCHLLECDICNQFFRDCVLNDESVKPQADEERRNDA